MKSAGFELFGLGLSILGSLLVMVSCGLPMWKVTAFIDSNIVIAQTIWDGLWMSCVVQSTGQMQCKFQDSVLALSQDVQTARALTVISSVMGVQGLMVTIVGMQCTNCIQKQRLKSRVVSVGGVIYIVSGLLVLVPLCWMANSIIVDFYSLEVPSSKKREIGAAIYIGWAATALLLVGGSILCYPYPTSSSPPYEVQYPPTKSIVTNGEYDKKNYV